MLDASASLTLVFGEENPPYAASLREALRRADVYVPQHWPLEVTNGLLLACRRSRMSVGDTATARNLLLQWPITVDGATGTQVWGATCALAERHRLTTYDAAYLELALRLDATLATVDDALADAARELGANVFGV